MLNKKIVYVNKIFVAMPISSCILASVIQRWTLTHPRYPQTHAGFGRDTRAASGKPGGAKTMAKSKKIMQQPAIKKLNNKHNLMPISSDAPDASKQVEMDLHVEKQVERDGIDMGVLSDGTAFLSGRGLARWR